jgi:hypothetical protein
MAVVKPEKPASALMRVALAASDPLIYLHYGSLWVATAGCLAIVIGRLAFGEVEGSPMLSAASSVVTHSVISGVLLFPFAMVLICVRIMRSVFNGTFAKKVSRKNTLYLLICSFRSAVKAFNLRNL